MNLPWIKDVVRAKQLARLPTVLNRAEVESLLAHLDGSMQLVVCLLHGTGMRLMEGVRLRVKDVDFERREILIRDGRGVRSPLDAM